MTYSEEFKLRVIGELRASGLGYREAADRFPHFPSRATLSKWDRELEAAGVEVELPAVRGRVGARERSVENLQSEMSISLLTNTRFFRIGGPMLSEEEYRRLREDHEVAYFRADLALSDPEGYSLEEKAEIIEGMRSSTEEVERAMREDFESMPSEMRRRMFEMLASSGPGARGFWSRMLLG